MALVITVWVVASATPFAGGFGTPAEIDGEPADQKTEYDTLHQSAHEILHQLDRRLHLAPEDNRVAAHHVDREKYAAEQRGDIEHQHQGGYRKHAGQQPGLHDTLHRIDGHEVQRIELLGGFHQADFGGDRSTRATGKQDRGQHRRQFAKQRERQYRTDRIAGTKAGQGVVGLQGQHQADEEPADDDDHQRTHADEIHLAQDFAELQRAEAHSRESRDQKYPGTTEFADRLGQ